MEAPPTRERLDKSPQQVTERLIAWSKGEASALDDVMRVVYQELRRMAGHYLRLERPNHTLQPTALVHEAYLRLVDQTRVDWKSRAHFFGVAAQMMRRILVDHARTKHRDKRGGMAFKLPLDDALNLPQGRAADLVALDEALKSLGGIDERKSRVVELRFFGGLSVQETADVLEVSPQTVLRDWRLAKAWLYQEIKKGTHDSF